MSEKRALQTQRMQRQQRPAARGVHMLNELYINAACDVRIEEWVQCYVTASVHI